MSHVWITEGHDVGLRLDKFLVGKLEGQSRAKIQKAIEGGEWTVNGKQVPPHHFLKESERVERAEEVNGVPRQAQDDRVKSGEIKVIAEREDYVVIDKPAGIAVHPALGTEGQTVTELLVDRYPELYSVGEDPLRPGVVHRIDKLVSGVLVFARNQEAFIHFKKQFQSRKVKKQYTALVHGTFVNNEGVIDLPLVRSTTKGKRGKIKALPHAGKSQNHTNDTQNHAEGLNDKNNAREALTRFEVSERFPRFTLLHVYPETGRTHQIRAHFAGVGHPIVGDPLYHGRVKQKLPFMLARPFLHAVSISFIDREGNVQTYESTLPPELANALEALSH